MLIAKNGPALNAGKIERFYASRWAPLAIAVVFIIIGVSALTPFLPFLAPHGDSASYIILAENLATGRGYVNSLYPGDPIETQYPPLFPLLLAPLVKLVGRNYLALKLVPLVFGASAILVIFELLRRGVSREQALVVTLLTALNATYLSLATSILSETVYLFFSFLALIIVNQLAVSARSLKMLIIAALLLAASFYTRTIGISLIGASILFLLFRRHFKATFILAVVLAIPLSWWVWRNIQLGNPYVHHLLNSSIAAFGSKGGSMWTDRILHNLSRYAGKVVVNLIGGPDIARLDPYQPLKLIGSLLLSILFVLGFVREIRRGISLEIIYIIMYLGICAVWPYHDARFLLPILPFVLSYVLLGAKSMFIRWPSIRQKAASSMAVILAVVSVIGCMRLVHQNRTQFYPPEMARYREACEWIRSNTDTDEAVLCRLPRLTAFWSDRKAWWYVGSNSWAEILETSSNIGASHLIINNFPISGVNLMSQFEPILRANVGTFRAVFQTAAPQVTVYEIFTAQEVSIHFGGLQVYREGTWRE